MGRSPPPTPPPEPLGLAPTLGAIFACWILPLLVLILDRRKAAAAAAKRSAMQSKLSGSKRRPIVGGNWKCNPESPAKLGELIANINACDTSDCDVYVCPSPLHVAHVQSKIFPGPKVAAQNCNFTGCGAYTGEMAVDQMASMGLEWCLIGHSERRGEFGLPTPAESEKLVAQKLAYILSKGLKCIFCIGEPLSVRKQGLDAVLDVCASQLVDVLPMLDPATVVIAYEPVWSIGTGVTATPEQAQETHAGIRAWLAESSRWRSRRRSASSTAAPRTQRTRRPSARAPMSTASWSAARRSSPSSRTSSAPSRRRRREPA